VKCTLGLRGITVLLFSSKLLHYLLFVLLCSQRRTPRFDHWPVGCYIPLQMTGEKKVKEADLYSAFIEVPYTQGAQVWITQCYLPTIPYLLLPHKHHQMAHPRLRLRTSNCSILLIYLPERMKGWVGLCGWLRNETVYLPEGSHPSQY